MFHGVPVGKVFIRSWVMVLNKTFLSALYKKIEFHDGLELF